MSPIDPASSIIAQLRAYASAWSRTDTRPVEQHAPASAARTTARSSAGVADVAQSVLAISADDPGRRRKAFRIFLQSHLASECGVDRIESAAFQDIVDRVMAAMDGDPVLKKAVEEAGELLLATVQHLQR